MNNYDCVKNKQTNKKLGLHLLSLRFIHNLLHKHLVLLIRCMKMWECCMAMTLIHSKDVITGESRHNTPNMLKLVGSGHSLVSKP